MKMAIRGVAVIALSAALGATLAQADVIGGANVRATFKGWLTPRALPRAELVPVALNLRGTLGTTDGRLPPALRRVTIAINRNGKISTVGLPRCRRNAVLAATTAQALAKCRSALIGSGRFEAHIEIATQAPFPARGRMLAFNSVQQGRRVILAHIFGTEPVPTSQVLTLTFRRPTGRTFGTMMSVTMPTVADDWGHVESFRLTLHRRYEHRGKIRSLIEASCPAPRGFGSAVFSAAKGTYYLGDGRVINRTLVGRCKVRD